MAMGMVMNPKGFVKKAVENGARYIKVLLFNTLSIGKLALCGIVRAAHAKGLKVAVHATEVATVRQAVDAGADILLHESGVQILAATDANPGSFAPTVTYGTSMHREMELLVKSGMTPTEVLASATSQVAEVFGIDDLGTIKEGSGICVNAFNPGLRRKKVSGCEKCKMHFVNTVGTALVPYCLFIKDRAGRAYRNCRR